uniref:hypothetical protein n=1 Tax=Janthinobacterium sp. TaxID=1871054 RepID=UPI00293D8884
MSNPIRHTSSASGQTFGQQGKQRAQRLRKISLHKTPGEAAKVNLSWGDQPHSETGSGCRLIYQNVNGISQQESFAKAHEIGEAAATLGASVVALSETNLNWSARKVRESVTQIFRKYWRHAKTCFSSSSHKSSKGKGYQPGGT